MSGDDAPRAAAAVTRPVVEQLGLTPADRFAAAALGRARAAARRRGFRPGQKVAPRSVPPAERRSSAHADARDPALVGDTLARLAAEHGWRTELSVGSLFGRWPELVGPHVAERCTPEQFADGVLTVRADSHAWMVQMRGLESDVLARVAEEVGEGVVQRVRVIGPAGRGDWARGRRRVAGRGPRDTWD